MKEFLNRLSLTAALAFQPVPEMFRHDLVPAFLKTCIKEFEKELQDLTEKRCKQIDELTAKKETELMAV